MVVLYPLAAGGVTIVAPNATSQPARRAVVTYIRGVPLD